MRYVKFFKQTTKIGSSATEVIGSRCLVAELLKLAARTVLALVIGLLVIATRTASSTTKLAT